MPLHSPFWVELQKHFGAIRCSHTHTHSAAYTINICRTPHIKTNRAFMIFKFVQRKNKYIFRIRRHSVPSSMQKQYYFPRSSGGYIFDSIGLRKSDDAKCFWCLIHIFVQFPPSAVVRSTSISLHLLKMDLTFFSVSDISIFPSFFYKSFFVFASVRSLLFHESEKFYNTSNVSSPILCYFFWNVLPVYPISPFPVSWISVPPIHSACPHTNPHPHRVYIQCHCWRW